MQEVRKISGGIYLIADAGLDNKILLKKLDEALKSGVSVVQLYNTENVLSGQVTDINFICNLCHQYHVPVLVNNNWALLSKTLLDGVHFDKIPANYSQIKHTINKAFYKGITCSNDVSVIKWANDNQFDYISFCSMFPSTSADSCEIISFETVKKARAITHIPIFVAGGINLHNINSLSGLPLDGIAVISGIMASSDIPSTTENYIAELNKITKHEN